MKMGMCLLLSPDFEGILLLWNLDAFCHDNILSIHTYQKELFFLDTKTQKQLGILLRM